MGAYFDGFIFYFQLLVDEHFHLYISARMIAAICLTRTIAINVYHICSHVKGMLRITKHTQPIVMRNFRTKF